MTPEKFAQIKKDVELQKTKKIQAETKLESLLEKLKTEYDVNTVEQAETLLAEYQDKLKTLESKKSKIEEKLEALVGEYD